MTTLRLPPLLVVRTQSMPRAQAFPPNGAPAPESAWIGQRLASYATPPMPLAFAAAPARPITPVPWDIEPPWFTFVLPS